MQILPNYTAVGLALSILLTSSSLSTGFESKAGSTINRKISSLEYQRDGRLKVNAASRRSGHASFDMEPLNLDHYDNNNNNNYFEDRQDHKAAGGGGGGSRSSFSKIPSLSSTWKGTQILISTAPAAMPSSSSSRTRSGSDVKKLRQQRHNNPAMSDTAFLRKRTAELLRVTAAAVASDQDTESPSITSAASATADTTSDKTTADLHISRRGSMKVDRKTFHFLMDAWAFSGELDAADQAMALLQRMEEMHRSSDSASNSIRPDVRSYTKVINAISRSYSREDAGAWAEDMLNKMESLYLSGENDSVKPNTFTYTAVIEAYANSGAPNAAQKAEEICNRMVQKYQDGDPNVTPSARSFNAVIHAYAKSREEGAAQQAELVFDRMMELFEESGMDEIKPNAVNFNSLIGAWAKCGKIESARRAEEILERMEALYKAGDESMKPTTVSFNTVIDAYAKSGEEGAAERAARLLEHMQELHDTGIDVDAKPNVRSFNSVINAWAKSRHEDAALKAEELLDLMEKKYENGDEEVRPDVHSFCTVINAWARSQKKAKAERCHNLFREMVKYYEAGNTQLRPNVVAYNAVMNACAFTNAFDVREQNRAIEIAHLTLKELEASPYGNPDQVTYGTFLKVCANQMPDCSTRRQIVEVLFKKCCKDGQVGSLVLHQLKTMASEELYQKLLGKSLDDEVKLEDLPHEWWCNVIEGKLQRRRTNFSR